jgi:hypothetical protein
MVRWEGFQSSHTILEHRILNYDTVYWPKFEPYTIPSQFVVMLDPRFHNDNCPNWSSAEPVYLKETMSKIMDMEINM